MRWKEAKLNPVVVPITSSLGIALRVCESRIFSVALSQFILTDQHYAKALKDDGGCRDMLTDFIFSKVDRLSKSAVWTIFTRGSSLNLNKFAASTLDFLWQIEEVFGYEKTILRPVSLSGSISSRFVAIRGDKNWMKSPPLLSLYTLLIRANRHGFHKPGNKFYTTLEKMKNSTAVHQMDRLLIKKAIPGIKKILNFGESNIFGKISNIKRNYSRRVATTNRHSNSGIVAFSNMGLAEGFPKRWSSIEDVSDKSFSQILRKVKKK